MSAAPQIENQDAASSPRLALWLLGGGFGLLLIAGLLLWWREGDRLFADGLIAALLACF